MENRAASYLQRGERGAEGADRVRQFLHKNAQNGWCVCARIVVFLQRGIGGKMNRSGSVCYSR